MKLNRRNKRAEAYAALSAAALFAAGSVQAAPIKPLSAAAEDRAIEAQNNREFKAPIAVAAHHAHLADDWDAGLVTENMPTRSADRAANEKFAAKRFGPKLSADTRAMLTQRQAAKPANLLDGTGIGPQKPDYYKRRSTTFKLDLGK